MVPEQASLEEPLWDEDLIARYDVPAPRYTSYPPATQFDEHFEARHYLELADVPRERHSIAPLALYVHIPFCRSSCHYCACNRVITRRADAAGHFLGLLSIELALRGALHGNRPVTQMHWGGGTPTFLQKAELTELMHHIASHFRTVHSEAREYSIEIDPRTVDPDTIALLKGLGFNRISLGIQDFDPQVQRAVNRVQDPADVARLVTCIRDHRFSSLNFDLIYGLPHQSRDSFRRTIDRVIGLAPDRLALYNYAHLPKRFRHQRAIDALALPSAAEKIALLAEGGERLAAAGYEHIGMDHFVRPGDELQLARLRGRLQRNFQGYATSLADDLIGVGPSSISQFGGCFAQNHRDLDTWSEPLLQSQLPIARGWRMSAEDQLRRHVIMSLACQLELDIPALECRFGVDFARHFGASLRRLQSLARDGLIAITPRRITVTARGRLLLRNICMAFDEYADHPAATVCSRTI